MNGRKILFIFFLIALYIYGKKILNKLSLEINIYEQENIQLVRKSAGECTLFLQKNEEFPIDEPCKVLLIGSGARNTVKGGLGSGDVESKYFTTCEQGLEDAGFKITSKEWLDQYPSYKEEKRQEHLNYIKDLYSTYKGVGMAMVAFPEYDYKLKVTEEEEKADIAIYVLARNSGEGIDRRLIKGDALLTDTEIKDPLLMLFYVPYQSSKWGLIGYNTRRVIRDSSSPAKTV